MNKFLIDPHNKNKRYAMLVIDGKAAEATLVKTGSRWTMKLEGSFLDGILFATLKQATQALDDAGYKFWI